MKIKTPTKKTTKAICRWQGALEGIHRGLLYGWVIDTEQPDSRVVLEICINGEVFGCLIADVIRSDLAVRLAEILPRKAEYDFCHGFVADLGNYAENQVGVLTVRIANTDIFLSGHIDQSNKKYIPISAISNVFSDGGLSLHGWAIDPRDDTRALTVRAFVGHKHIAETIANLAHPTLRSFDIYAHGFNLNLPLEFADGSIHEVRVVDETGTILNGSPITVCCFAAGCKTLLPSVENDLLMNVINSYEQYLPRSLGLEYYQHWSALYETKITAAKGTGKKQKDTVSALTVAMIITGDAEQEAFERTTASLNQQLGVNVQVFVSSEIGKLNQSFSKLLKLALDSQCNIIACIRSGDTLSPHALICALEGFAFPHAQLVYTDSEFMTEPWFKPAWNPEYALSSDYPLELMLIRSSLIKTYFAKNPCIENHARLSWGLLVMLWGQAAQAIVHVPHVLYQFKSALSSDEQQARAEAAQYALQSVEPSAFLTSAVDMPTNTCFQARRLQRVLSKSDKTKTISLIIPTRDQVELLELCIKSLQKFTKWKNLEIIIIDNDSIQTKTKAYFDLLLKQGVRVLSMTGAFNFADLNNRAVHEASGEIIGLINNDIEALHVGWLDEIVSHLLSPGVGAVGAKLLWPNGMVQHGGVLLGVGNVAGHYGNRLAEADWGNHGRNQLVQQVSGVTAACLFLRKSDYLEAGGMDTKAFPVAFNDVDLCLKLRKQGKSIIWTPYARLLHAESASRGHEDTPQKRARAQREVEALRQRWGAVLLRDPAYHPSLNLDAHSHAFGGLAIPPRDRAPRLAGLVDQEK
jgi:GT2 family glycosyltransferase